MPKCNYCKKDISPDAKVCPKCGETEPTSAFINSLRSSSDKESNGVVIGGIFGAIVGWILGVWGVGYPDYVGTGIEGAIIVGFIGAIIGAFIE